MSYRILVLEGLTERGQEILRAEGWTLDQQKALPPDELVKLVPPYHAILVRSGSKMTPEVIDAAKNLKVIGRARRRASTTSTSPPPPAAACSS